jgi:hypothetical protein
MDPHRLPRAAAAILLVGLASCGGGGGGGGEGGGGGGLSNATFAGTYGTFFATGTTAPPVAHALLSASLMPDGAGTFAGTFVLRNTDGVVDSPGAAGNSTYAVSSAGVLDFDGFVGGITSSGDAILAASTAPGSRPLVVAGLRNGAGLRNATMTGTYHFALLQYGSSSSRLTGLGSLVLDGLGNVTGGTTPVANIGGTVFVPSVPVSGTYSVTGDGTVTLEVASVVGTLRGTVHPGGDVAYLGGDTVGGQPPRIAVLVRQGAGATSGTFAGDYWIAGFRFDAPSFSEFTSFVGSVRSDGVGTLEFLATTENTQGAIRSATGIDDYVVQSDGTLFTSDTAGAGGGPFRRGAVSSDGRFAFLCGEIVSGAPPIFFLLARKS